MVEVRAPAGLWSWQGEPQWGRLRYGVPIGGAMDLESYRLARELSGGEVLEVAMTPADIVALQDCRIAVVGTSARVGEVYHPAQSAFNVLAGEVVAVSAPLRCRSYVGVGPVGPVGPERRAFQATPGPIRVMPGPQATDDWLDAFCRSSLIASPRMDRRGIRLSGFPFGAETEIVSEPSCVGAIQLTPSGELIIIGPDGPTIGGYPKIAVVLHDDLSKLGQIRPGERVEFVLVP